MKRKRQLAPTYHLGNSGIGCAGDPPNHPRYFARPIYTKFGNSPPCNSPQIEYKGEYYDNLEDIDKLFEPLPLEHERVQLWIDNTFSHHRHCYRDPLIKGSWLDKIIIYPVPTYKLKTFHDNERFSDEWRTKAKTEVEQVNKEITNYAQKIATLDNHDGTIIVRRYYPEFTPAQCLIDNPPQYITKWWTTLDEKPTPENCPGDVGTYHPVNGTWCQFCGWKAETRA